MDAFVSDEQLAKAAPNDERMENELLPYAFGEDTVRTLTRYRPRLAPDGNVTSERHFDALARQSGSPDVSPTGSADS